MTDLTLSGPTLLAVLALTAGFFFLLGFLGGASVAYRMIWRRVLAWSNLLRDRVWPWLEHQGADLKKLLERAATKSQKDPVAVEEQIGVALHKDGETRIHQ